MQRSTHCYLTLSSNPRVLVQCIVVYVYLLLTMFKEGAWNCFIQSLGRVIENKQFARRESKLYKFNELTGSD